MYNPDPVSGVIGRPGGPAPVVISGIRRGIGRALAIEAARAGLAVAGIARSQDGLDALAAELQAAGAPRAALAAVNLADWEALRNWAAQLAADFPPPQVLIHAAAILGPRQPLLEVDPQAWNVTQRINGDGTFYWLRAFGPLVPATQPALWLWLSSSVATRGRAGWGPYAASKAMLENLTETFADEIGDRPWTSVTLNPGGTRTDMRAEAMPGENPATLPSAAAVAKAVWALVEQWREGQLESGSRFNVRELPGFVDDSRA